MSALHWLLWDAPPAAPPAPHRTLTLRGRADVSLSVAGRADIALSVAGRADTTIRARGSLDVAIKRNIEFFRGEAVTLLVEVEGETSLAGRNFRLEVESAAGAALLALTQASGITRDSPTGGWLSCALTAALTGALTVGRYAWGVAETTSGGEAVLVEGVCNVRPAAPLPAP